MRELSTELAEKAKELTRGMLDRVKRLPDVADYKAAFSIILAKDATSPQPEACNIQCSLCDKRAHFIIGGTARCIDHQYKPEPPRRML